MSEQSPAPDAADARGVDEDGGTAGAEDAGDGDARVVGLDSPDADNVLGAVSSDTARTVLDALHEEPSTASDLAERVDLSLQTVQYHLGNLSDAGLVSVVDTTTSDKGREMDVYGPAGGPVVVFAGDEDDAGDLRAMLSRLVTAVGFLAVASLVVQELVDREPPAPETGDAVTYSAESARAAGDAAAGGGPEPGLVFFAGGLVMLAAYLAWWYLRSTDRFDVALPT